MKSLAALLVFGSTCSLVAARVAQDAVLAEGPETLEMAHAAITAADIERTMEALASDEMAGRRTGDPECTAAGDWLAARLKDAGVQPAGDEGSYRQAVPLFQMVQESPPQLELLGAGEGGAALVARPQLDFDRFAGSFDGTLKLVVVQTPEELPAQAQSDVALFTNARGRRGRELAELAGVGWGALITRGPSSSGSPRLERHPRISREGLELGMPRLRARGEFSERLAAAAGAQLRLRLAGRVQQLEAFNVVGVLPGAGTPESPQLGSEVVVFSAHYDHIGVVLGDLEEDQDRVFNGADDDASGCAAVLELAEAFGAASIEGRPPARTLVFLFTTAEEQGMLGTRHYVENPVGSLADTVCNLNFEMLGRPCALVGGSGKLWLSGYELSSLGAAFGAAGLDVGKDPYPGQGFFERSDNIVFVREGIVGQTLSSYDLHKDYHQVGDDLAKIDFEHMRVATEAALQGASMLADGELRPEWAADYTPPVKR